MPTMESRVESVWFAKQTGKGSPATTALKLGRKTAGDLSVARTDGSENYQDGHRFQNTQDFVDQIVGNGAPTLQGQPGVLAALFYLMLGQEVVTGTGDPFQHVSTPNEAGSFWTTWWDRHGSSVVERQKFNDCKLVSLRVEASSASKIVHVIPTFISLDAGEIYTSDPIQLEDPDGALIYTEGEGRFTIDGVVYRGHSALAFTITDGVTPWFGDAPTPFDVVYGAGNIAIDTVTLLLDQAGLAWYNTQYYGTPTPSAGAKPLHSVPGLGAYALDLQRGVSYQVTVASATGGTFTLTATGSNGVVQTTAPVAFDAAATVVQAAIQALPGLAGASVSGTPGSYVVSLSTGTPAVTADGTALTGAGAAVSATSNGPLRQFKVEFPGVKWTPPALPAGSPDGGALELGMAAATRTVPGQPHIRTTIRCGDAAFS